MSDSKYDDFRSKSNEKFTMKEKDILDKTKCFFASDVKYIKMLINIIEGHSNISIRVLDWFVSNYSKKFNIGYRIRKNGIVNIFNVYSQYKNQLNGYSKQYFDPFCRKKKIIYSYKDNITGKKYNIVTSIGQLNFFQWAIQKKVITHVSLHLDEIESDMKKTSLETKEEKKRASESFKKTSSSKMSNESPNKIDKNICSSDKVNNICIGSSKKKSTSKSDSEGRLRRRQLSKSAYSHGIKKSNVPVKLGFE